MHKLHPHKQMFIIAVFGFLTVAALYLQRPTTSESVALPEAVPTQVETSVVDISTHEFEDMNVRFSYPDYLSVSTDDKRPWSALASTKGITHALIVVPGSIQKQTNFQYALFTIGSSVDRSAVHDCLVPKNTERARGQAFIKGLIFQELTHTSGTDGYYADAVSYRTVKDNTCYAIEYTIHSSNLRNFAPEQMIAEFDTAAMVELLESLAQSVSVF